MSDGKTHFSWWFRLLPFSLIISFVFMLFSFWFGIFTAIGYSMGSLIEPDQDHIGLSLSDGMAMRKFGILGVLWVMYWMPYAYVLPHRSPFSHWPVLSTIIRLLYVSFPFVVLAWYTGYLNTTNLVWGFPALSGVVIGLSFSDTVHFVLDTKAYKKFGRLL